MKLTDAEIQKLEDLANSSSGRFLVEYLEKIKADIADIRNYPDLDNQMRLGVIEVLDDHLVNKLKTLSGELSKPESNEWE